MKKDTINIPRFFSYLVIVAFFISSCSNISEQKKLYLLDMVHHNPGEPFTETAFRDPVKLANMGYDAMVVNEFIPPNALITYESIDPDLFPASSDERAWMDQNTERIKSIIQECKKVGLDVYCFTDIIVIPEKLKQKYYSEICNKDGDIDIHRPKTQELHRMMFREIFQKFPLLDGLVIRTGETYLHNMPYHTGNNPILNAEESHIELLNIIREEVCEKLDKKVFYRTWDFGFFHVDPEYYLNVTDAINPHENLTFSIKHTEGDYHRTFPFNPTLGIGRHKQIVEVQCQREYEGKGAHPNYIPRGVIHGFEEYHNSTDIIGIEGLLENKNFTGVWTWSRGGGWVGPYIENELWCDLNAYVMAKWTKDPKREEEVIFNEYFKNKNYSDQDIKRLRRISLLSAKGVVRGHNSLVHNVNVWWMRDHFFGGLNELRDSFQEIISGGLTEEVIKEKEECRFIWDSITHLADELDSGPVEERNFIRVSSRYGLIKYSIVEEAWKIMLLGMHGDMTGQYDKIRIEKAILAYDRYWKEFHELKKNHQQSASIYIPYAFIYEPPYFKSSTGMKTSVNRYRDIISQMEQIAQMSNGHDGHLD